VAIRSFFNNVADRNLYCQILDIYDKNSLFAKGKGEKPKLIPFSEHNKENFAVV